jgi:uncharacterized protein (DUF1697 family)
VQVWIALLRAINLGGRRKVPMAELRALCGDLGWQPVRTYIASGNVVLASPEPSGDTLAAQLSAAVSDRFGFPVPVMVRSADELRRLIEARPLDEATQRSRAAAPSGSAADDLHVGFLADPPRADQVVAWRSALANGASMVVAGPDVYLRVPGGLGDPFLTGRAAKDFGEAATIRGWRTVTALGRLAEEMAGTA